MVAVLLIEDNPGNRAAKAGLLKRLAGDGPVVAVESSDAAIRALRVLPGFELIVSDISLPKGEEGIPEANRDGIALAKWIQKVGYPAAVAGYSAIFSEREISDADKALFFDFLGKAENVGIIVERVASWIKYAEGYRERSRLELARNLGARSVSPIERPHFSAGVQSFELVDISEHRVIRELMKEGFSVKLAFPDKISEGIRPFFVWYKDNVDGKCFVEVFGCPRLYATGSDLGKAEENLMELMRGYFDDLNSHPDDKLGDDIRNMVKFLREIFHGR